MGSHQPIRKTVTPEIPDKLYFRIGDVARLCEVPTYVLRFWETEFPQLKPNKGGTGQRLYRRRDVELALRIKSLLYDQGYTIPGARQVFKSEAAARSAEAIAATSEPAAPVAPSDSFDGGALLRQQARLRDLRVEVAALLAELSQPVAGHRREDREARPVDAPSAVPQGFRPRLVLEPRPRREANDPVTGPRLQLKQRDLFSSGPASDDDGPEPPIAS